MMDDSKIIWSIKGQVTLTIADSCRMTLWHDKVIEIVDCSLHHDISGSSSHRQQPHYSR
jgi:hypothetical protein